MKHKLQKNAEDAQEKCRCISSNLDSVHSNLNQVETEYSHLLLPAAFASHGKDW